MARLTATRIDEIAELIRSKVPLAEWPAEYFRIEDNIRRADILLGSDLRSGDVLGAALARVPDAGLVASGMRSWRRGLPEAASGEPVPCSVGSSGRTCAGGGGAGFTTGLKWEACRNAPLTTDKRRIVVCNADEGRPRTFKD
ncbi:MAG: hypothetical protein IPN75_09310 [Dechloromonas sp.]|uniref:Uncharacterized protein n=1 Tax=Candidatus Dechloromonas phosphorivorans TaxID=2899244 RepID=A0A9D7QN36_9RHOO|nr:hypothetical protein [Candidatus Dechloromonas phosphorivorans]